MTELSGTISRRTDGGLATASSGNPVDLDPIVVTGPGYIDIPIDTYLTTRPEWEDLDPERWERAMSSNVPLYALWDPAVDAAARAVEYLIKSMPEYQGRELGAIIYLDDATGDMTTSPIALGEVNGLSYPIGAWNIKPYQIFGLIHSHPQSSDPVINEANKYPSDNRVFMGRQLTGEDWNTADFLVMHGMNSETFRHYIIGPDGVTREYNYHQPRGRMPLGPEL